MNCDMSNAKKAHDITYTQSLRLHRLEVLSTRRFILARRTDCLKVCSSMALFDTPWAADIALDVVFIVLNTCANFATMIFEAATASLRLIFEAVCCLSHRLKGADTRRMLGACCPNGKKVIRGVLSIIVPGACEISRLAEVAWLEAGTKFAIDVHNFP